MHLFYLCSQSVHTWVPKDLQVKTRAVPNSELDVHTLFNVYENKDSWTKCLKIFLESEAITLRSRFVVVYFKSEGNRTKKEEC